MKAYKELVAEYEALEKKLETATEEERLEIELDMGELEDQIKRATCHISMCVEDNYS